MAELDFLENRYSLVKDEVNNAASLSGRSAKDISIIAISKTVSIETIKCAHSFGQVSFGENRTKIFKDKFRELSNLDWHFIGSLQSNKARDVVGRANLIHSLDRPSLLRSIQKCAKLAGVVQRVLIEVNISGEETKGGISPRFIDSFIEQLYGCENVRCIGLMTMAPKGDLYIAQKTFAALRKLSESLHQKYECDDKMTFNELSMGMSNDFVQAIKEGATMVRIGRRLFNENF